eukprot:scaffold6880_cov110-Isochrysis_galbana.AAC.3
MAEPAVLPTHPGPAQLNFSPRPGIGQDQLLRAARRRVPEGWRDGRQRAGGRAQVLTRRRLLSPPCYGGAA